MSEPVPLQLMGVQGFLWQDQAGALHADKGIWAQCRQEGRPLVDFPSLAAMPPGVQKYQLYHFSWEHVKNAESPDPSQAKSEGASHPGPQGIHMHIGV